MQYSKYEKLGEAGKSEVMASKSLLKKSKYSIDFDNLGKLMEQDLKLEGYRIQWYDALFWGSGTPQQLDIIREGYRKPFSNTLSIAGLSAGGQFQSPMQRLIAVGLGSREKDKLPFANRHWGSGLATISLATIAGAEINSVGIAEGAGVFALALTGLAKVLPYSSGFDSFRPHNLFSEEFETIVKAHNSDVVFRYETDRMGN